MKRFRRKSLCLLVGSLGLAAVYSTPAQAPAAGVFQRFDKNGDGKVTKVERPNAQAFARYDLNKAGRITQDGANEQANEVFTGQNVIKGGDVGVGRQIGDLAFTTLEGKAHRLSELRTQKGALKAMTSTTCPVRTRYAPGLVRLEKDLAQQKVYDSDKALAASLHARGTTELLLLDMQRYDFNWQLRYDLKQPKLIPRGSAMKVPPSSKTAMQTKPTPTRPCS